MHPARTLAALATSVCLACVAGCGADSTASEAGPTTVDTSAAAAADGPLVIYSGRSEELVGPLLDQLEAAVGTEVDIRYASSAELAAQLLEEGEASDADVFFSQDAGALGALAKAGMLTELDAGVTDVVAERFRDSEGNWVATSARARVLAYDPKQVPGIEEIDEIADILSEEYRGKIAFAPTNASFQAFVTALRVIEGEDGAREWLTAFAELEPEAYESNDEVLAAVDRGDAALGLLNHYYWYQKVAEVGINGVAARIHFLDNDDPGALVNVAGVGVLATTDQGDAADAAVEFLVSDVAQAYFADETAEYPVVDGITTDAHDLEPLGESAAIDLNDLDSLEDTLALLDEVGLT